MALNDRFLLSCLSAKRAVLKAYAHAWSGASRKIVLALSMCWCWIMSFARLLQRHWKHLFFYVSAFYKQKPAALVGAISIARSCVLIFPQSPHIGSWSFSDAPFLGHLLLSCSQSSVCDCPSLSLWELAGGQSHCNFSPNFVRFTLYARGNPLWSLAMSTICSIFLMWWLEFLQCSTSV